jgi:hypothetical protein
VKSADTELITVHGEVLNPAHVRGVKVSSHRDNGGPMDKEHKVQAVFSRRLPSGDLDVVNLTPPLRESDASEVMQRATDILYGRVTTTSIYTRRQSKVGTEFC